MWQENAAGPGVPQARPQENAQFRLELRLELRAELHANVGVADDVGTAVGRLCVSSLRRGKCIVGGPYLQSITQSIVHDVATVFCRS